MTAILDLWPLLTVAAATAFVVGLELGIRAEKRHLRRSWAYAVVQMEELAKIHRCRLEYSDNGMGR